MLQEVQRAQRQLVAQYCVHHGAVATLCMCVQAATTQWHGAQAKDWQGKSWIAASKKAALPPDVCFLPKRWVHTWGADGTGHTKGVNCIRFFPKTGHLLLSAGLDSKVKVRRLYLDTYMQSTIVGVLAPAMHTDC